MAVSSPSTAGLSALSPVPLAPCAVNNALHGAGGALHGGALQSGPHHGVLQAGPACSRDTRWLTLEVCREYQRGACSRTAADCKFAHPPAACHVDAGRVIACFDSLKGRCTRENCKYLHPPPHLKTQLEVNGRNNLIQQKLLAQQMHSLAGPAVLPGQHLMFPFGAHAGPPAQAFAPYLGPVSAGMGLLPHELLGPPPTGAVVLPGGPVGPHMGALAAPHRTDRLEVCREFMRGNCCRGESECRFAHPGDAGQVDQAAASVTVCMDHLKGRCARERCKYFHPPAHLQAKLRASQQQAAQHAAAMALAGYPVPQQAFLHPASIFCMTPGSGNIVPMMHAGSPASVSTATTSPSAFMATANQMSIISIDPLSNSKYVTHM